MGDESPQGTIRHRDQLVLNLGSGTDSRGIGIDLNYDEADVTADLNDGIPAETDCARRVIAEHVLEHLENPAAFLEECHRVLQPDGVLNLEVPNAGWLPVRLYVTQDIQRFWEHKIPENRGHWLARRLGDTDPDRTQHLTLWTKRLLTNHLDRADFQIREITGPHWRKNIRVEATPNE